MTTQSPTAESAPVASDLEQRFLELAERWREETQFYSTTSPLVEHPAYREILQMGEVAVPWLLRDMAATGARWTLLLREITGENPAIHATPGQVREVQAAWIEWGRERYPWR